MFSLIPDTLSNTISNTASGTIHFDFIKHYNGWFKFGYSENISRNVANLLDLYSNSNFKDLNIELSYLYNRTKIFLTEYNCILILNLFNKCLKFKYWLYHIHHRKNKSDWKIVNNRDLSFNNFKSSDTNLLFLANYKCKTLYTFRLGELLSLYKFSLQYDEDEFIAPKNPTNPYTNDTITLKQHIELYNTLLQKFCKRNKTLPELYILFKNSYFDTNLFYNKNYIYLKYTSIHKYVIEMKDETWVYKVNSFLSTKSYFCLKCFRNFRHKRKVFDNVLILFILNEHKIYVFGNPFRKFIKLAKKYNLYFDDNHAIKHRKHVRPRRRQSLHNDISNSNS